MIPRTLDALRSAVARVLTARGEAPDALRVTLTIGYIVPDLSGEPWLPGWHVHIAPITCGIEWDGFVTTPKKGKRAAVEDGWRAFVASLECEHRAATRSGAGIRRPERRPAAYQRIMRATAALAAARAVEAGE